MDLVYSELEFFFSILNIALDTIQNCNFYNHEVKTKAWYAINVELKNKHKI
jgi:hypothetical protein